MLNSIGLENVGCRRIHPRQDAVPPKRGLCRIRQCVRFNEDEYAEVVDKLNACEGIAAYELNISCPNTKTRRHGFRAESTADQELTKNAKGAVAAAGHREAIT